jgi:hypothetical protein
LKINIVFGCEPSLMIHIFPFLEKNFYQKKRIV